MPKQLCFSWLTQFCFRIKRCAMDTTLSHDYNSSRNWQTFALRAFRFFNDYESFYIHCELLACLEESISSR